MASIFNLRMGLIVKVSKFVRQDQLELLSLPMCVPNLKTTYPVPFDLSRRQIFSADSGRKTYHQIPNISRILVANKIVDHSGVVGASPVGAAPTTSSFST